VTTAVIRLAVLEDASVLAELAERTFRDAFAAQNTPEDVDAYIGRVYGEELQRRELVDPLITTIVAEISGSMIGFVQIKHGEGDMEVARLYVDRRFHGQGIAQQLMDAVIDTARETATSTVWLGVWEHNPRAIAFYEKCGFRITGSHPFLLGSDLQTDYVMVREG
jgi:ribosomal protein S18 acetylase RimI-like enzyme